ncbi:hypothetical protein JTB14_034447 [Gonioctena quinquepunctata]|nr:hypothetical protein JTB14_034447 [Gonioctena quinquepunctata]
MVPVERSEKEKSVNLSPALSNDCDADRLVKKPMLHDMFDLLGLPLYNTGLAVYSIFSEDTEEDMREDIENAKVSLMNTISVVNAAGRWRRKQKKMSALHSRSNSAVRTRSRSTSANIQKIYMTLPKVQVDVRAMGSPTHNVQVTKPTCDEYKKSDSKSWGNGRDWNLPKPREGGWVRIWPLAVEVPHKPNHANNGYVKGMVNKVMKFTRTAKDLAKKHPTASECQLSEFLQEEMKMTGDVWIPPI